MRRQPNQYPSSIQPHPPIPLFLFFFPKYTRRRNCHRLVRRVVSLSPAPVIVLHSISQRCLRSGDFYFESLQWKLMWPWRGMSVSFRPEEEGECSLKVLSFMSLIDRRLSEWLFFLPVITTIRMGLNASSLGEWKRSSPGERKAGPVARLRGLSLTLLAWHRELTLTGSFIQTDTKSPRTGRLRDNYI